MKIRSMKKLLLCLLLIQSTVIFSQRTLKMGVITDTHYLSEQLMDGGYTTQDYVYTSGRNIMASPEILDQVVLDYMQSDIDVLLVCGDLVKDGEKQSHIEFRDKLKPLYDKGVKIFVIPGNHDFNISKPLRYQGNKTFETESVDDQDFREIYADYGYNQARNRHLGTLSYTADLDENTLLLAIDASVYNQSTQRPNSSGTITQRLKDWIEFAIPYSKEMLGKKRVIAMMHWGVVEHLPMQGTLFPDYLIANYKEIASFLADNGIELIFTGHFHSNDISSFESEQGNTIYDIETGSLTSYPFSYRFVNLYPDSVRIETKNITSTKSFPKLKEESIETMKRLVGNRIKSLTDKTGFEFSEDELDQVREISQELYILHLQGDEVVTDEMKDKIWSLFEAKGLPIEDKHAEILIDFLPLDNNLTIKLRKILE